VKSRNELRSGVTLGERGQDFVRALIARAVAPMDAASYAAERWGDRAATVTRAAVEAGTSGGWAAPLVGTAGGEFFAAVAERSIIGRLAGLRRMPTNMRIAYLSGNGRASWVGESWGAPLTRAEFSQTVLDDLKVQAVAAASKELLESADIGAESVIRAELVRATVQALDEAFINPANAGVADTMPASITNGIVGTTGSTSPSADFKDLVTNFTGDLATAYLLMQPRLAVGMYGTNFPAIGARGGTAAGIPVITSRYVPAGLVALVDPGGIAVSEGPVEQRVITQGDIFMDNAISMSGGESVGSPPLAKSVVSLWQANMTAFAVTVHANWKRIRAGSVAVITGAGYGNPSGAGSPA
jgi:hypothetical protein